jgi:hypothetical protein
VESKTVIRKPVEAVQAAKEAEDRLYGLVEFLWAYNNSTFKEGQAYDAAQTACIALATIRTVLEDA